MLVLVPLVVMVVVGFAVGALRMLASNRAAPAPTTPARARQLAGQLRPRPAAPPSRRRPPFAWGWGFLAGLVVLCLGLFFTLISPREISLDEIDYTVVEELPERTQPRLLPRTGHHRQPGVPRLRRDPPRPRPESGELTYTGEWRSRWNGGESGGVAIRPLDDLIEESDIQHDRLRALGRAGSRPAR